MVDKIGFKPAGYAQEMMKVGKKDPVKGDPVKGENIKKVVDSKDDRFKSETKQNGPISVLQIGGKVYVDKFVKSGGANAAKTNRQPEVKIKGDPKKLYDGKDKGKIGNMTIKVDCNEDHAHNQSCPTKIVSYHES